jgi:hypothetical protein
VTVKDVVLVLSVVLLLTGAVELVDIGVAIVPRFFASASG